MAGSRELLALIHELKRAGSPVARMRLLARAWRTVRRLSSWERRQLATQLGMRELEGVLEKLGLGQEEDGISPAEVLEVLDQVDDLDPSEVSRAIQDLRDPARRREWLRKELALARDALAKKEEPESLDGREALQEEQEEENGRVGPPGAGRIAAAAAAAAGGAAAATIATKEAAAAATPVEPREEEPAAATIPPPGEEVEAEPTAPRDEVPPPPSATRPEPDAAREAPESRPEEVPLPDRPPLDDAAAAMGAAVAPEAPVRPPTAEPIADAAEALLERLKEDPSITRRFRLVRDFLAEGGPLDRAGIQALLERFPPGWTRRRILSACFREGQPEALDDALALIEALQTGADRRWCTSLLAHTRGIAPAELRRLRSAAAPTAPTAIRDRMGGLSQ